LLQLSAHCELGLPFIVSDAYSINIANEVYGLAVKLLERYRNVYSCWSQSEDNAVTVLIFGLLFTERLRLCSIGDWWSVWNVL